MTFSQHAKQRMTERRIDWQMIELVLAYGREMRARRSRRAFVIGNSEIARNRRHVDLSDLKGLVIIVTRDNEVVTCYQDPKFDQAKPTRWS
jgi:hypothetical protein